MTALFALSLLLSLGLATAAAFAPPAARRTLKAPLVLVLLLAWGFLAAALAQIGRRTVSTVTAPAPQERKELVQGAAHEALTLLLALGGPALLATALAALALRASRDGPRPPERLRGRPRLRMLEVQGAGGDLEQVRALFAEYAAEIGPSWLPRFDEELRCLPGEYHRPRGRLWIARVRGEAAGCVGLRGLRGGAAEIKRLFVRPAFRGHGVGRALVETALAAARRLGYVRVRLDTLPTMREALSLYRRLGFYEIPAYQERPLEGARFLELGL